MAGVYWIGNDGNYYARASDFTGVKNFGFAGPDNPNVDVINRYSQIDNPSGPAPTTTTPTAAPSGGSSAPAPPPLNVAAVNNTQRTIGEIPGLLEAALAAERTKYGNIVNEFGAQEQGQRGQYEKSTTTNTQNYDANMMDSVRAGARGLSGLMALLRGTGVEDQARDIVGTQTNQDIRGGLDTRNENQTQLDTTLSSFLSDLDRKRRAAEDTRVNNERAATRDMNTTLQDLYGKMAGFYSEAGDRGTATSWMNRAGDLTPTIAANSRAQVSAYDTAPVQVKAPEITAFAAPAEQALRSTAADGQIGSGIFTVDPRRRRDELVAPAYAGV